MKKHPFSLLFATVLLLSTVLTAQEMAPVRVNLMNLSTTTHPADYNNPDTIPGWNTIGNTATWVARSRVKNMKDVNGSPTGIEAGVYVQFTGGNTTGLSSSKMGMVDQVSKSFFYGQTAATSYALYFTGLDKTKRYDFALFGSRSGTSNGTIVYTFDDANRTTATLNVSNNLSGLALLKGVQPNADTLKLTLARGVGNGINLVLLNALQITESRSDASHFSPFLINFGAQAVAGWPNTMSSATLGADMGSMENNDGDYTSVGVKITSAFSGTNTAGSVQTATALNMPDGVSESALFASNETAALQLYGLAPSSKYKISIFGSRKDLPDEVRNVKYILTGKSVAESTLNVADNVSEMAVFDETEPKSDGTFDLQLKYGEGNTSTYTYINAMKIEQSTSLRIPNNAVADEVSYVLEGDGICLTWNGDGAGATDIRIFDAHGALLQTVAVSGGNYATLPFLGKGLFLIRGESAGKSWAIKVVK